MPSIHLDSHILSSLLHHPPFLLCIHLFRLPKAWEREAQEEKEKEEEKEEEKEKKENSESRWLHSLNPFYSQHSICPFRTPTNYLSNPFKVMYSIPSSISISCPPSISISSHLISAPLTKADIDNDTDSMKVN
jgi:hypothetical protein